MSKLLVNAPTGKQELIEVGEGGGYFDASLVLWDDRTDGPMPAITLGGMVRQGGALVYSQDRMNAHAAATAPTVPQSVTMRQAVLALLDADLLDDVEAIVAVLPRRYQLEWERAANVYRDNALVETVRQQKSMTESQIDDLFIAAFAL